MQGIGVLNLLRYIALIAVLATVAPAGALAEDESESTESPAGIDWILNYNRAVELAKDSNQHVITLFYTDWCPWSKRMMDSTFTDPRVTALQERFLFAKINAELDTATASKFNVSGYPTVILLETSGNEVDRVRGYMQPEKFATTMVNYLEGIGTFWALQQADRENRDDPETVYRLGQKEFGRGNLTNARSHFERVISTDPKNESGYSDSAQFFLGIMLRREREWFKAAEAFRTLVKEYPESDLAEDAQLYIGWLYGKAGDTKAAIKNYESFLDDFSGSSEKEWAENRIEALETAEEEKKAREEQQEQGIDTTQLQAEPDGF